LCVNRQLILLINSIHSDNIYSNRPGAGTYFSPHGPDRPNLRYGGLITRMPSTHRVHTMCMYRQSIYRCRYRVTTGERDFRSAGRCSGQQSTPPPLANHGASADEAPRGIAGGSEQATPSNPTSVMDHGLILGGGEFTGATTAGWSLNSSGFSALILKSQARAKTGLATFGRASSLGSAVVQSVYSSAYMPLRGKFGSALVTSVKQIGWVD
jgi:hypothetical protein